MNFHYQTQPIPNPFSALLHQSPTWFHRVETLVNHIVELGAPWMLGMPRRTRIAGGVIQIAFQVTLVLIDLVHTFAFGSFDGFTLLYLVVPCCTLHACIRLC